ncbi:MAG: hypothetical protein MUO72_07855 [Bacteroidales bacterium]|nr:hypothetical protein [Bacteroidales bacterium]
MWIRKLFFLILSTVYCFSSTLAQVIIQPNYGLKSHETLEIRNIELTSSTTTFYLSIENRIPNGNFCADKNIFMIYPDGSRSKLASSTGIPVCPDTYKFKTIGEKLDFILTFPPLKPDTKWVDILEECNEDCFSFYGVTLDNELNRKLDDIFSKASKGKPSDNINLFTALLDSIDNQNLGIEGLLYINIINAAVEEADKVNAIVWYKRLASSGAPRLNQYLKYLNDKGIKY